MFFLKQSTASQKVLVKIVDAVDGYTPETGVAAPTIKISKAGAAFGNPNDGTWAELAYGIYTVQLDATDSNTLALFAIHVEKTGCRNFEDYGYVLPTNVYDSLFGTENLSVKLTSGGLDSVATTEPAGVASDFREMVVQLWRRFFIKSTATASALKTYKDDDSVCTTQTVSFDGTTKTVDDAA